MQSLKAYSPKPNLPNLPSYIGTQHSEPPNVITSCFQFSCTHGVKNPIEYLHEMHEVSSKKTVDTRGISSGAVTEATRIKTPFDQLVKSGTIEITVLKNIYKALIDDSLIFNAASNDTPIRLYDSKGNEYRIQIRHEQANQYIDLCHPDGRQETLMTVPFYFAQRLQQNKAWLLDKYLGNIDLRGLDLTGVTLSRAHLETIGNQRKNELNELKNLNTLKETHFQQWHHLTQGLPVPFENPINLGTADFSETDFRGGTFQYLDLSHSNLGGQDLTDVHFKHMDISNVQLSGTCVKGLKLTDVVLNLYQFRAYSNSDECTLNNVSVNLNGMDFSNLRYGDPDLRHVKNLVISNVGNANLKGLQLPEDVQITAKLSVQQWCDFKQSNPASKVGVTLDYASMKGTERGILSMMHGVL